MLIELVGRRLRPWELNPRPFVILTQWFITEPQELLPAGSSGLPKSTTSQARFLHFLPHEEESGECYTSHPDPAVTGQAVTGSGPGPCVPLAWSLGAWLVLQSVSVAQLCDSVRPLSPKFRGIWFTSVKAVDAPVLRAEIAVLLAKDAIEPVPPADMRSGFYSPYFIVPKKSVGLRTILDLWVLSSALHKLPFKMRPSPRLVCSNWPEGRVLLFLRFAFDGQAYQYKVLPFGLSLSPRVFTKVMEATLVPLRERGVHILNYLDDWLILAQSHEQLCAHRDLVIRHLSQLGLRVNWEKSQVVPMQKISFLGMELDSVNQTARLTQEHAQSVLNCLKTLSGRTAVPLKLFQRLLGYMATAAVIVLFGLIHVRPHQQSPEVGMETRYSPGSDYIGLSHNLQPVERSLVPSGRSAPGAGIQAFCGVHGCLGHRLGSHVQRARSVRGIDGSQLCWYINCLELLAVCLALNHFRGQGHSGPYGQHGDRCVYQPASRFTLPSHVASRPPPPPLQSETSEVPSGVRSIWLSTSLECSIKRPTSCCPWTGRGDSGWPALGGSSHNRFSTSTVHKVGLCIPWQTTFCRL